jgi:hypothetical protein
VVFIDDEEIVPFDGHRGGGQDPVEEADSVGNPIHGSPAGQSDPENE